VINKEEKMTMITKSTATILASPKIKKENGLLRLLCPKDLVSTFGTSEEMVRNFLRKHYSEVHVKNKHWNIRPELAKQIEKDYKNLVQARDTERKLRIEKELAGEIEY
jgi:hypothetical protein